MRENPELNQGLDIDEKGFPRRKKEQFTAIVKGYIGS